MICVERTFTSEKKEVDLFDTGVCVCVLKFTAVGNSSIADALPSQV